MGHLRGSQKQTVKLRKFHHRVRSTFRASSHHAKRFVSHPKILLVGLTATAGISSLAFATQHQSDVKSQTTKSSVTTDAAPQATTSQSAQSTTSVNVENSSSSPPPPAGTSSSQSTVTINNEAIPLDNGSVQRVFTDTNGNSYVVNVSIDSQSTSVTSHSSTTDITIDNSNSTTQNTVRGSPRR